MVAKDSDHTALFEAVDELDKQNKVPLNKTYDDLLVNFLEYVEYDEEGSKCYSNSWITSLRIGRTRCQLFPKTLIKPNKFILFCS